ncbi:NfeD family protein [Paenibacillus sp. GCM10012307]|uniref:Protease n=1 Tax=Paenibacillus roseus TaxID=2798579 RepID=A0A934JAI4_9BACL|nr:protease [Paenibacillus roseus]
MEILFWSCLSGGILYAVITVIFGDVISEALDGALDFLSGDTLPWLQPMTLVSAMTIFGGAGLMLSRYTALGTTVVIIMAAMIAIILGIAIYFLYVRPMENSENSTGYSIQELGGKVGEVLVPIPSSGYGEVIVNVGAAGVAGQIAASFDGQEIPMGSKVVVVDVKEGTLLVSKIEL